MIKKRSIMILILIAIFLGCQKDIELNGNIEVYVEEVNSICSTPFDEIEVGLFPPEAISQGTWAFNAIEANRIDEEGYVRFNNLPAGTYIVAVKESFCEVWKYAIVRGGETTRIELLD